MRATVVLPVPGAPVKMRWWLTAPTASPALRRHSLTWISSISARTSLLTPARPIIDVQLGEELLDLLRVLLRGALDRGDPDLRPVPRGSASITVGLAPSST